MSEKRLEPIERLVKALRRLPGIGEKTATRLAYFLLAAPDVVAAELGEAIVRLRADVRLCDECFNLTARSPCEICRDESRSARVVCVVEEPADLASIESTGSFRGRYHVLGGTIAPLDGVGPESLRIEALVERIERGGIDELILATNPNPEGEATALYVAERVARYRVPVTRIGYGMPIGGDLEYVDPVTVRKSLENRRAYSS
ncbi:MAG TPA: recombination mediator RecR [Myxococcota bacterium]|nr:recombination mediator RecR [Myxococcota bacterium]